VQSVLCYAPEARIVVVDDTGRPGQLNGRLGALSSVCVIAAPTGAPGARGGLWVKLASGFRYALSHYDFDVLLRLDADALMIGPGLEELARARFDHSPGTGMLGSYRYDTGGGRRDFGPAARLLAAECGISGLRRPGLRRLLRAIRREATKRGYVPGEHALGGAYLQSRSALEALDERGFLDLPELSKSRLGEDHLFGLLTVAAGFMIADFGGPNDPMALRWEGLPAAPAELLARNKLVTHSVRFFNGLDEASIRATFAAARAGGR